MHGDDLYFRMKEHQQGEYVHDEYKDYGAAVEGEEEVYICIIQIISVRQQKVS